MQRKRGGLVPIGELAGPPYPPHYRTFAHQITHLLKARDAEPELGFIARTMALCSMPRTNPGDQLQYKRGNGPFTLYMTATGGNKLPYGNLPRLLMSWVCSEAVKTGSREIVMGRSLGEFMRSLGIDDGGGRQHSRLREQMKRLFGCSVSLVYADDNRETSAGAMIADLTDFWWHPKRPDQPALWKSKVRLSEQFFNEIVSHPVPLNTNALHALKRSSLGLDLYMWLTYRTFALRDPLRLNWRQIYRQFGARPDASSDKRTVQNFRAKVLRELKKIKLSWPGLNYETAPGVLVLHPSTPAIPPSPEPLRFAG